MIIPPHCKVVGRANGRPCGDQVYFLTRYLVRDASGGYEVVAVEHDPNGTGMMRRVVGTAVLACGDEVMWYPKPVNLHDRTSLVERAMASGSRCTIFSGHDEHITFVLDPDLSGFQKVHVYDIEPPRPHLSATVRELQQAGLFGELDAVFLHHVRDIRGIDADVYPCGAAGFPRTLDADPMRGGERVAGCMTGSELYRECYGDAFELENICPLAAVRDEPFIARCCRSEREGVGMYNGKFGAVVHWGASPRMIAQSVADVVTRWRSQQW